MATMTSLRQDNAGPTEVSLGRPDPAQDLSAFREGRTPEDRLVDLLAFALAAEKAQAATPPVIERLRQEATATLTDHAFRYLHNSVDQIRRDAITEHLGALRKPPGFGTLLLANLVALAIAGLGAYWLATHPAIIAGLAGLLSG